MNVTVKYSADKLTARMRARITAFTPAVRRAEEQSARAMLQRARALSNGWIGTDELRKLGHPYSINSQAPIDPAIINRQTGNFEGRWQYRVTLQGEESQITLFNTAGYARFMLGTSKMQPRPILQAVYQIEQGARVLRLQGALRTALNK